MEQITRLWTKEAQTPWGPVYLILISFYDDSYAGLSYSLRARFSIDGIELISQSIDIDPSRIAEQGTQKLLKARGSIVQPKRS